MPFGGNADNVRMAMIRLLAQPAKQKQLKLIVSVFWCMDGLPRFDGPVLISDMRILGPPLTPAPNGRCGSRLCENSDVELARRKFVSITLNNKRTALAVTVERRKERTQFCAFSARARFHTAWVKTGKARCEHMFSALPLKADITLRTRYVRFVPKSRSAAFIVLGPL